MEKIKPVTGPWNLKQIYNGELGHPKNGLNVLSTFSCGGGSTMGYKLAGFNLVGCVEIDKQMMDIYRANHSPKHAYLMGVQDFNKIPLDDLPSEFHELDVLDGSPPCSVFSTAGKRDKGWGVEKQFREGQAHQRLDDLFFHFIHMADRLRPKVVVAENVMGMLKGAARGYVKEIFREFDKAGYDVQLFQLNSRDMGVPQSRPRIFFIGRRKDLKLPSLQMEFSEKPRTFRDAVSDLKQGDLSKHFCAEDSRLRRHWLKTVPGHSLSDAAGGSNFTNYRLSFNKPAPTLCATGPYLHPSECRHLSDIEKIRVQSFPDDFNFCGIAPQYICGMSVPPLMMQRIALKISDLLAV